MSEALINDIIQLKAQIAALEKIVSSINGRDMIDVKNIVFVSEKMQLLSAPTLDNCSTHGDSTRTICNSCNMPLSTMPYSTKCNNGLNTKND